MKIDTTSLAAYPGLTEPVAEIIELLRAIWYDDSGPAHVVIADYNLEDDFIQSCIKTCESGTTPTEFWPESTTYSDYPPGHPVMRATAELLRCLLEIPEAERIQATSW